MTSSQANNLLTNFQVNQISNMLHEWHGSCLEADELTEAIYQILEDIPGLETAPEPQINAIVERIRRQYHDDHN